MECAMRDVSYHSPHPGIGEEWRDVNMCYLDCAGGGLDERERCRFVPSARFEDFRVVLNWADSWGSKSTVEE